MKFGEREAINEPVAIWGELLKGSSPSTSAPSAMGHLDGKRLDGESVSAVDRNDRSGGVGIRAKQPRVQGRSR